MLTRLTTFMKPKESTKITKVTNRTQPTRMIKIEIEVEIEVEVACLFVPSVSPPSSLSRASP